MTSFTPSSFWIPLTLTLVAFAILPSMVLGAGSGSSFLHATGIVLVALGGGMLGLAGFWFVSGARKIPDIAGSASMGFAILA